MAYKLERMNEDLARTVASVLRDLKEPVFSTGMVSVTGTDTTKDLKYCKVYYSVLNADSVQVKKALERAAGFIRREVAVRLNLRNTPEFHFVEDTSSQYGAKIDSIFKQINERSNGGGQG